MGGFFKFIFGCVLIAVIGVITTYTKLLPGSLASAEQEIDAYANSTLNSDNYEWARVETIGQKVQITGEAPNSQALDELRIAIQQKANGAGMLFGPVTLVDHSGVKVFSGPPPADPFILTAERLDQSLVISGFAPSQNARDTVFQLAAMRFPDLEISGDIELASGAPPEDDWVAAISTGLQALTHLSEGVIEAENDTVAVIGKADNQEATETIATLVQSFPAGIRSALDIDIVTEELTLEEPDGTDPDNSTETATTTETDTSEAPLVTEIDPVQVCSNQVFGAISSGSIVFDSARAEIEPASIDYLRRVATALADCPDILVAITGHTDSSGLASRNQQLSLYRADAVAAYLASFGVESTRLTTRGVGATSPIAPNDTVAGRAQNRRIEFELQPPPDNTE